MKLTTALTGFAVAFALAGCTWVAAPSGAPKATPAAAPEEATVPGSTTASGPIDHGPTSSASGTAETDVNGTPVAYIVADGDSAWGIEKRFGIRGLSERYNRYLQPGERLSLSPSFASIVAPLPPLPANTCNSDNGPLAIDPVVDGRLSLDNLTAMRDTGKREYATGKVTLNAEGRPASYAVAAGDAIFRVADRLCVTPIWLDALNSVRRTSSFTGDGHGQFTLYAGDVLNLDPATISTVGSENGTAYRNTPTFPLPPQR